jgi:hypothetical protein
VSPGTGNKFLAITAHWRSLITYDLTIYGGVSEHFLALPCLFVGHLAWQHACSCGVLDKLDMYSPEIKIKV